MPNRYSNGGILHGSTFEFPRDLGRKINKLSREYQSSGAMRHVGRGAFRTLLGNICGARSFFSVPLFLSFYLDRPFSRKKLPRFGERHICILYCGHSFFERVLLFFRRLPIFVLRGEPFFASYPEAFPCGILGTKTEFPGPTTFRWTFNRGKRAEKRKKPGNSRT